MCIPTFITPLTTIDRLNLKEMWYIYTMGYYSEMKTNTEIMPLVTMKLNLGGSNTKASQQQRKKIADD